MAKEVKKLPEEKHIRATIIELYFSGLMGNTVYLNNIDINDVDEAIKLSLEARFPGAVTLKNEPILYENDIQRIIDSYCVGRKTSLLKIMLRVFIGEKTLDNEITLRINWFNIPEGVEIPDVLVYHDCHSLDCEQIGMLIEKVIPLNPGAYKSIPEKKGTSASRPKAS